MINKIEKVKVNGSIPKELYVDFEKWMLENNVRSQSQGIWLIIEQVITGQLPDALVKNNLAAHFKRLEKQVKEQKIKLENLTSQNELLLNKLITSPNTKKTVGFQNNESKELDNLGFETNNNSESKGI